MLELTRLRADHAAEVLVFERANRAYFAASVSDRGDDFFDQFTDRYAALLAEQEAGVCAFYVLVAEDGAVLGRFNLFDIKGNWRFENGFYIHAKTKTEVVTGKEFDLAKFVKRFAKFIDVKFKIAPLVKLFTDADQRRKSGIEKYDLALKNTETLEIKYKADDKEE